MANTQSMCSSFAAELFTAVHNFGTSPIRTTTAADQFYAALYYTTATLNSSTTAYTSTGEVSSSGTNYTAGGVPVASWFAPISSIGVAFTTPTTSFVWPNVTINPAFDAVLIYTTTQGGKSVSVHTFGAQLVTAGTFTLSMPTNAPTTGLLRIVV